jgi:hypothetical protein
VTLDFGWDSITAKGAPWGRLAERSTVPYLLTSAINLLTLTLFGFLLAVGVLHSPHHVVLGAMPAAVGAGAFLFAIALPRLLTSAVRARTWKHARLKSTLEGLADSIRDTERFLVSGDWRTVGAIGYLAFDIIVLWSASSPSDTRPEPHRWCSATRSATSPTPSRSPVGSARWTAA